MSATLVMFSADGKRRDFPLKSQIVIIGRNESCGLRIPLSSVSRQHCQIELRDDDEYWVRDLGSSNGTLLNDERVVEEELEAGDQLMVGPVKFTVVIDGVPAEIKPEGADDAGKKAAADVMGAGVAAGAGAAGDSAVSISMDDDDDDDDVFDISFDDDDDDDDEVINLDMGFDDDDEDDDATVQVDAAAPSSGAPAAAVDDDNIDEAPAKKDKGADDADADDRFNISFDDDDEDDDGFDISVFTDDDDDDAVSALESMGDDSDDSDIVPVFDFDDDDDDNDDD